MLAGPQGTTFGANAQSGALRIITDEPDSSCFLTSIETGFKMTWMDGRMRANVAIFRQSWEDFHFSRLDTSISPITLTYNVGNSASNGVEGDFMVLLTDNWQLSCAAVAELRVIPGTGQARPGGARRSVA